MLHLFLWFLSVAAYDAYWTLHCLLGFSFMRKFRMLFVHSHFPISSPRCLLNKHVPLRSGLC